MQIENSFSVGAPADRVFAHLLDVNSVVGCVPGAERPLALLSVVDGDSVGTRAAVGPDGRLVGSLGGAAPDTAAGAAASARLVSGLAGIEDIAGVSVFIDPIVPSPRLAIIGAVHIAIPLSRMAAAALHRVVVIDPRAAFLTTERIPDAHRLVARWPDEALPDLDLGPRDAAVCLAHDPKFEDPALTALLRSPVGYIGAIGSRATHARRLARLREAGFDDNALARVHSPVGLDIGAATPEEIAVAILAEVVAVRRGRGGRALSDSRHASVA